MVAGTIASCSGSSNGDIEAYCALVEENFEIGLANSGIEQDDLEALLIVSPVEIASVVEKLRNTLADIAEIDEKRFQRFKSNRYFLRTIVNPDCSGI